MGKKVNAFCNDALGTMDATGVAEAIATKKISATEATEAAIQRAEQVNSDLNAIIFKTYDIARKKAALNGGSSVFSGVPAFIKDTDNVTGTPTQMGTLAFHAKTAKRNSKFVDQFLSTGLNPLGKTTMPEFGLICSTENERWGITRNPWNTDYTTGGSSSGSAAMVASGVVPIASANDGAGSIRIPASCCGLVGLKPSRNRLINADGTGLLPLNIIYQGVLTRSVRDTAAFYAAAEKHFRHPQLPEMGHIQNAGKKRLKIAFFENIATGKSGHQDADTYATLQNTAKLLQSLGHQVESLPFPYDVDILAHDFLNYYGLMAYAMVNWGGLLLKAKVDRQQLEPFTTGVSQHFRRNMWGLPKSLRKLKENARDTEKIFDRFDIILSPVLAHKVPPIGYLSATLSYEEITRRLVAFAPFPGLQNVSGSPAISLPMGTSSDGLPIGLQFVAPHGHDKRLIELAYELEEAQPWKFVYSEVGVPANLFR